MQSSFFASSNAGMKCVDGWSEGEGEEKVEHQMRKLELEAYAAVVRAFGVFHVGEGAVDGGSAEGAASYGGAAPNGSW